MTAHVIGLTGGIASGKSTVARLLVERGAIVVDADQLARAVVEPGQPALAELVARFGAAILTPEGELDRNAKTYIPPIGPHRLNRTEYANVIRDLLDLESDF